MNKQKESSNPPERTFPASPLLARGGRPGYALWWTVSAMMLVIAVIEIISGNQPIAWFAAALSADLKAGQVKNAN